MTAVRRLATTLALFGLTLCGGLYADGPAAPPPVGGQLARAVLLGGPPLSGDGLPEDLPSADRLRLLGYIDRRNDFVSRQPHITGSPDTPRIALEREIASVIEKPGIDQEAWEIAWAAGDAPVARAPEQPEAEAEWAESILRSRPDSPAAPYFYAFLASRYRLMFERAPGDDRAALERLARKYRTMLERTRGAGDSLFVLLAGDLDGLPRLSTDATRHPREYLPDT